MPKLITTIENIEDLISLTVSLKQESIPLDIVYQHGTERDNLALK